MRLRAQSFEEQTPLTRAIDAAARFFRRAWYDLLTRRERRRWDFAAGSLRDYAAEHVPGNTSYCYGCSSIRPAGSHLCPFWHRAENLPEQQSGYCSLLRVGDWQDAGASLLWDQVKECGINRKEHGYGLLIDEDTPKETP